MSGGFEILKEYIEDTTGRSPEFFDTVLKLTDYMEDALARQSKEEVNFDAEQEQWLNYVKENAQLSDEEKEKLNKYVNNMVQNLKEGKTMKNKKEAKTMKTEKNENEEIPNVDEIIKAATKKPTFTVKHQFSPHDLRDVSWEDIHTMTKQNQFRADEIVKAQKVKVSFGGVIEKFYEPELLYEEPGVARVTIKPGGFELEESRGGGKREIYQTPQQALRAVSALKKEERLRKKEEELNAYEELSNVDERLAKEEDSLLGHDLREKIKEAKRRLLKATFPSAGKGTRTQTDTSFEAGANRKQNPVRLS